MKTLIIFFLSFLLTSCKTEVIETECIVTYKSFRGSTLNSHAVPIVSSNGNVSMAVATSGEGEKYSLIL